MTKRGNAGKVLLWLAVAIIGVWILYYIFSPEIPSLNLSKHSGSFETPKKILLDTFSSAPQSGRNAITFFGTILEFVVGKVPKDLAGASSLSTLIVVMCIWAFIFVAFGDIFRNLSFFDSKKVPWILAGVVTIAAANLGLINNFVIFATMIFAGVGVAAVYLGLGASFVAFVAIELGISSAGPWLAKRKAMKHMVKTKLQMEGSSNTILGAMQHYLAAGEILSGKDDELGTISGRGLPR